MPERRQFRQAKPLKDRLAAFAEQALEKAKTSTGPERDELIRKARRADTAAHLDEWVNSSGLQPPE